MLVHYDREQRSSNSNLSYRTQQFPSGFHSGRRCLNIQAKLWAGMIEQLAPFLGGKVANASWRHFDRLQALGRGVFDIPPLHGAVEQVFQAHHLFADSAWTRFSHPVGLPAVNILRSDFAELIVSETRKDMLIEY